MNIFKHCEIELGPESRKLSGQQKAVVLFLALGLSNKAIGTLIHRSPETVKTHVDALLKIFNVDSRAGIVGQAFCHGVLQPCAKVAAAIVLGLMLNGGVAQNDARPAPRRGPSVVRISFAKTTTQNLGVLIA